VEYKRFEIFNQRLIGYLSETIKIRLIVD